MPQRERGLCSTCANSPECVNRGSVERPKYFCEEFFNRNGRHRAAVPDLPPSAPPRRRGHRSEGLCYDCENHDHCTSRNVDGGVWHCEEYC